ncbi:MAG: DUF6125 family protein [Candidatus Thermoplasmatota archaeon]
MDDISWLRKVEKEKLIELLLMHIRCLWTVDGLYFIGIEEKFGTSVAKEIDENVWSTMGKIEARKLKKTLNIVSEGIDALFEGLRASSWSLDLEKKEIIVEKDKLTFINKDCRVQKTRISKGLSEFPCKNVRFGFLKAFAKEFSQNINVNCIVCPPDKHTDEIWCKWEFVYRV